jgi:hypothetical protein
LALRQITALCQAAHRRMARKMNRREGKTTS